MHRLHPRVKQVTLAFGLAAALTLATVVPSLVAAPTESGVSRPSAPQPVTMNCPWC